MSQQLPQGWGPPPQQAGWGPLGSKASLGTVWWLLGLQVFLMAQRAARYLSSSQGVHQRPESLWA
jgi:hypothetical protein